MATSMTKFHMQKGDSLFIEGTSLIILCALVIVSVLIAWAIGGSEYKDSFYGDTAMAFAGIGFIAGVILDFCAKNCRRGN